MRSDGKVEFNLLFRKIQQCTDIKKEILTGYFKNTFIDLNLRMEDKKENMISLEIFSDYCDLPLIVCKKIFESFKEINRGDCLRKEEFMKGIYKLYFTSLEDLLDSTFKIFASGNTGKILFEDVLLILTFLNISSEFMIKNLETYIKDFFGSKEALNKEEYNYLIKNKNSNVFIIFLILLYSKQPFSKKSINFYEENCYVRKRKDTKSFTVKNTQVKVFICKPSNTLNFYMKFVGKSDKSIKRKSSTTNVLDYDKGSNPISAFSAFGASNYGYEHESSCFVASNISSTSCNKLTNNSFFSSKQLCSVDITKFSSAFSVNQFSMEITDEKYNSNNQILFKPENSYIEDEIFIRHGYNIHEQQARKIKIVLIEKDLYIFKQHQDEFIFDRLIPLSGYYPANCTSNLSEFSNFSPFALVCKFGNLVTSIFNIFLFTTKEEKDECLNLFTKFMEVRHIDDDYKIVNKLGQGQFGKVYLGTNKKTEEKVAVKIIKKENLKDYEVKVVKSEVDVVNFLKFYNHPNVVKAIDVFEDKYNIYIVMECIVGRSLDSYLQKKGRLLTEKEVKDVANQIGKGLEFLHSNGIIHRDIKTENIMLSNSDLSNIKIVDFGLAKVLLKNEKTNENYGTLLYSAPEVLKKYDYDSKVDVWSLGVLIYYLLTSHFPFDGSSKCQQTEQSKYEYVSKICHGDLSSLDEIRFSDDLKDLIRVCLIKSGKRRLNINELLDLKLL